MKKFLLIPGIFALLLCGCQPDKESLETSNDGVTTVEITKDNLDTYFNISRTGKPGSYQTDYSIIFKGVLTFAVYENVEVSLNMHIYGDDGRPYYNPMNSDFERKIQLNAAGEGMSTLYYSDGTIDHIVNTGLKYDMLAHYECTWSIKAVTGTIKYRL